MTLLLRRREDPERKPTRLSLCPLSGSRTRLLLMTVSTVRVHVWVDLPWRGLHSPCLPYLPSSFSTPSGLPFPLPYIPFRTGSSTDSLTPLYPGPSPRGWTQAATTIVGCTSVPKGSYGIRTTSPSRPSVSLPLLTRLPSLHTPRPITFPVTHPYFYVPRLPLQSLHLNPCFKFPMDLGTYS